MATADGDHATAQRILDRLFGEGTSPIPIMRALQRHYQRLHLLAGLVAKGKSPEQAIASLPVIQQPAQLFLSPKDAALVKSQIGEELELRLLADRHR